MYQIIIYLHLYIIQNLKSKPVTLDTDLPKQLCRFRFRLVKQKCKQARIILFSY